MVSTDVNGAEVKKGLVLSHSPTAILFIGTSDEKPLEPGDQAQAQTQA